MNRTSRLAALAVSVAVVVGSSLGTAPAASAETTPTSKFSSVLSADQVRPGPGDPTWWGAAQINLYEATKTWMISGYWGCPELESVENEDGTSQYADGCPAWALLVAYRSDGTVLRSWRMLNGASTFSAQITADPYFSLLRDRPERFRFILSNVEYPTSGGQGGIIAGAVKRVTTTSGVAG